MIVEFKEPNSTIKHLLVGNFAACSVEELVLLLQSTGVEWHKPHVSMELILWAGMQGDEGQSPVGQQGHWSTGQAGVRLGKVPSQSP